MRTDEFHECGLPLEIECNDGAVVVSFYLEDYALGVEHPCRGIGGDNVLHLRPRSASQYFVQDSDVLIGIGMTLAKLKQGIAVEHAHVLMSSARPEFTVEPFAGSSAPCRVAKI
jgi:hypothetical protein